MLRRNRSCTARLKATRRLVSCTPRRLRRRALIDATTAAGLQDAYRDRLDRGEPVPKSSLGMIGNEYTVDWSRLRTRSGTNRPTQRSARRRSRLGAAITHVPADVRPHGRVQRIMDDRARWRRRDRDGLGFRRNHGVRFTPDEGLTVSPGRAGQRSRYVLPPPCGVAQPGE